ncbi:MAG TPA: PEP-CTERM sorting domain-containing protein, partial [Burkholderiales bacterium]|nr:PEP-CTERM sorting domain-containing protein [Burkholderiales bacterium]
NVTLPVSGTALPAGVVAVNKGAKIIDLDANTLAALGNKSPEKWEGLAIGPQLAGGGYLILAGTDNDYSVTQSGAGQQFDVYFRLLDADPYATSIQCPLDQVAGCFFTANNAPATLTGEYALLPSVLHAYAASAADLAGLVLPVPVPGTVLLLGVGLLGLGVSRRTKRFPATRFSA